MAFEKIHKGYTIEQIFWWVKRLGHNVSMRVEAGEYRLVFAHKSCGTQELYGSLWVVAKNAIEALGSAVRRADRLAEEAFAIEFPESTSA